MIGNIRKIVTILLIISLLYANVSTTVFGIISYALENDEEVLEEQVEAEKKEILQIQTSDIVKNNMSKETTEYQEDLIILTDEEDEVRGIVIDDIDTKLGKIITELDEEENEIETSTIYDDSKIFYKSTTINKDELFEQVGTDGTLEITYYITNPRDILPVEHDQIQEHEEVEIDNSNTIATDEVIENAEIELMTNNVFFDENVKMEPGIKMLQEEPIKTSEPKVSGIAATITADTEADEDGNIVVEYPEDTDKIKIEIKTNNSIHELRIKNNKEILPIYDIEQVNKLVTSKNITVEAKEKGIVTNNILDIADIEYSKTEAELGVDKNQISTSVENNVNFTITMLTNSIKYDLYKNPVFVIELPKEITSVRIDNAIIINNEVFEVETLEQGTLEDGSNVIVLKLNGEQTERTNSMEENIQIVFNLALKTEELIPTLDREVKLHYLNENANTYNGIEVGEEGLSVVPTQLVSNNEVIVETKAIVGDTTITSLKNNFQETTIEPNTYNNVKILGTAINNTGVDLLNAKILVSATNISEIAGVEEVYYTENENASAELNNSENFWTAQYTQNAKKALIILPEYMQGQTVMFGYNMNLPEKPEEDITHVAQFEVYDSENNYLQKSAVTVNQEAERIDIVENKKATATITLDKEAYEVGEFVTANINLQNVSEEALNNISIEIDGPETEVLSQYKQTVIINGQETDLKVEKQENKMYIKELNIAPNDLLTVELMFKVLRYNNPTEKIYANINLSDESIEVFGKAKIIEPSRIETTLTSNKLGKELDENELIEYEAVISNVGESHARVDLELANNDSMNIHKMEIRNLNTNETKKITSGSLDGIMRYIDIGPGETLVLNIEGEAKSLKKDDVATMFVNVKGDRVYEATTNSLSNKVNKQKEIEELPMLIEENNDEVSAPVENTIKGTAWIDKNENARKDEKEVLLKGVQAKLINSATSEVVATQVTDKNGEYEFTNLPEGKYVVEFNYNNTTFGVTEYKKEEVEKELDSDVINTTQGNRTTSKTETIKVQNGQTEEINAGFVMNKKFDLSINNTITKVIVDNDNDTNTFEFNQESNAEVKINSNTLKNSLLLVEYEIEVKNNGTVAGYAKSISNEIPEGMIFNSELNTNWYEGNDGKIYTAVLANKELQPGETATLKLVLTKEIADESEVKITTNAKINQEFNEYLIEDSKQENDLAETIITVTTKGRRK